MNLKGCYFYSCFAPSPCKCFFLYNWYLQLIFGYKEGFWDKIIFLKILRLINFWSKLENFGKIWPHCARSHNHLEDSNLKFYHRICYQIFLTILSKESFFTELKIIIEGAILSILWQFYHQDPMCGTPY